MSRLSIKLLVTFILVFSLSMPISNARSFEGPSAQMQQKGNSNKRPARNKKVKSPPSMQKVKKEAEKKKARQKQDYAKYVTENQKRSIAIQTPEVKARMKQNIKDANSSYTTRHKNSAASTRKAGRKYR